MQVSLLTLVDAGPENVQTRVYFLGDVVESPVLFRGTVLGDSMLGYAT